MPWPGTNIPAPWDPTPAAAPPDTTQRDTLVKTLAAQHGGAVGTPSTPLVKNPKDPNAAEIPGPYDLYSFADGTSVEIAPTGEVSKYTPKTTTGAGGWTDITQVRNDDQTITFYGKDPKDPGGALKPVEGLPKSAAPESTARTATPAAGLERLDKDLNPIPAGSTAPTVFVRDPNAPAGTAPFKVDPTITTDPSTWTPIKDPNDKSANPRIIGLWDPANNKIGASVTAPTGSKDSDPSTWKPIYRTPGDTASGIVGQWDPVNNELHAVSAGPDNTQVVQTTQGIYSVDKAKGTSTLIQKLDPADPNKQSVVIKDKAYVFDPKAGTYTLPTNIQEAATVGNSTTLKDFVWYTDQGVEVGRQKNTNYQAPQTTQGAQSTTARQIQQWNPDTGKWEWIENKGRITASEALKQMATSLTGQVVAGDMSQDEAVALINAANAKMTNDINAQQAQTERQKLGVTAASDVLTATQNAATTGAGLLQNRVTNAMSGFNTAVGAIAGSKMTSAPAGMGANLVGGLSEWVTGLGGGQPVYDSAAAMVNQANPAIKGDPTTAQQAYGALRGAMDLYKQQTGQDYIPPAQRNQQFTAPDTTTGGYNPAGLQWNQPANAASTPGRTVGPGGVILGPNGQPAQSPPPPPVPVQMAGMAAPAQVPGQNYGLGTTGNPINPATGQPYPTWLAPPGSAIPYIPNQFQAPVTV